MSFVWNMLEKNNCPREIKYMMFLVIQCVACAILGFLVWRFVSIFALKSIDWMICFTGYPVFVGLILGIVFLYQKNDL